MERKDPSRVEKKDVSLDSASTPDKIVKKKNALCAKECFILIPLVDLFFFDSHLLSSCRKISPQLRCFFKTKSINDFWEVQKNAKKVYSRLGHSVCTQQH